MILGKGDRMTEIQIFRTGKHTDRNGNTREWTEADLDEIVHLYNNRGDKPEAPIVFGHPKDDTPAQGWVRFLTRKGDALFAKLHQLSDDLVSGVRKGAWKYVSIALRPDRTFRHLGLLGGATPAVSGPPVEFGNDDKEYSEWRVEMTEKQESYGKNDTPDNTQDNDAFSEMKARIRELSQQMNGLDRANKRLEKDNTLLKARLASSEFSETLEGYIADGRVLPSEREPLMEEFRDLRFAESGMEFAEGEKTLTEKFKERLAARPVLSEPQPKKHFATQNTAAEFSCDFTAYAGIPNLDPYGADLDAKAHEYMEKHPDVSYEQAVMASMTGMR